MKYTFLAIVSLCVLLLMLAGCGGDSNSSNRPPDGRSGGISVTVKWPAATEMKDRTIPASTKTIVVSVVRYGETIGSVTITTPETTGQIPNIPIGTVIVRGTAKDADGVMVATGYTPVTVLEGQTVTAHLTLTEYTATFSITPASAIVRAGDKQTFAASLSSDMVNWSVTEGATGGTIDQNGVFTASFIPGTYQVTATSKNDSTKTASATVTIPPIDGRDLPCPAIASAVFRNLRFYNGALDALNGRGIQIYIDDDSNRLDFEEDFSTMHYWACPWNMSPVPFEDGWFNNEVSEQNRYGMGGVFPNGTPFPGGIPYTMKIVPPVGASGFTWEYYLEGNQNHFLCASGRIVPGTNAGKHGTHFVSAYHGYNASQQVNITRDAWVYSDGSTTGVVRNDWSSQGYTGTTECELQATSSGALTFTRWQSLTPGFPKQIVSQVQMSADGSGWAKSWHMGSSLLEKELTFSQAAFSGTLKVHPSNITIAGTYAW